MRIYNTLTKQKEEFVPLEEGKVKMYVCGPTVYNLIHIGNARPMIIFDTFRRYLEYKGYDVNYVSNFTDVDDKIIKKAIEEGTTAEEISQRYIKECKKDMHDLNIEPATTHPLATQEIDGMIEMIKTLIDKGYAYDADGTVYYRTRKFKDYGKLSKKNIDDLEAGHRDIKVAGEESKEDPLDFVLWKPKKEGEPSWPSPWSDGRPGWHIECSVMSKKYLGDEIDIHAGGEDLIFPHHENEIAQSKCSCGGEFARYWMHNGYININGEKMSKSGTFMLLRQVLDQFEGRVIRLFILGAHYRKPMDFSNYELNQAKSSLERIENALLRAKDALAVVTKEGGADCAELAEVLKSSSEKFVTAMDDDFNTAQGLGAIFELIKELNKALEGDKLSAKGKETVKETVDYVVNIMQEVLGVILKLDNEVGNLTSELVEFILELRREARADKNWAMSDKIRDRLAEIGIKIKDGKDTTTWSM